MQVNVSAAHANKPRTVPIDTNNLKRMEQDSKIARDLAKEMDDEIGWKSDDGEGASICVTRLATICGPEADEVDGEGRLARVSGLSLIF